ncbi:putative ribonuclease H-like domain-containing protein [Tanacetum coccineum]
MDEGAVADFTNLEPVVNVSPIPTSRINSIHPSTLILGDPQSAVQTRSKVTKSSRAHAFKISEALEDESWVDAMQEELLQFKIQKVWILVDLPYGKKAIGTKWVYRNKKDERGVVVRNKARIFLAFASYMGFIVYQMDVKSAFLYGKIDEEVYVSQPPGFIDPKYPKKVYKVVKALYGLHQAPRAWYATLSTFLLKNGYRRGTIDKTLFIKKDKHNIILVQVYVDDIIFGSTKKSWCDEFKALMKSRFSDEFYEELTILSWITSQTERRMSWGMFLWTFGILECPHLTWKPIQIVISAGVNLTGIHTGVFQFLAEDLIPSNAKKQTIVLLLLQSKYFAAANKCYGKFVIQIKLYHSKTKHIEIRHHFIRDAYEKKLIQVLKIHTDDNVADLLTKAFDVSNVQKNLDHSDDFHGVVWVLESHWEESLDEKTRWNAEFHEIIDFLARSSIHNALTVCPVVSITFVEQFWMSAKSKIINNVRYITAKVAGKSVSISEASIRSDLLFDDADGIDSLSNQAIFDVIQLMGYEGDLTLMNVPVPLDHFPVNALTNKVLSFIVKKGKHFSGKVTPLFSNMLVQPTEDEGEQSERPSEPQPTPFPPHPSEVHVEPKSDPSPTTHIPDSIPEVGIKEGRKSAKVEPSVHKDPLFDELADDTLDYMDTENAQDVGKTRNVVYEEKESAEDAVSTEDVVSTDKEKVSTDRSKVSTDRSKVSTDRSKDSTDRPDEGTVDQTEGKSATPTTPTPTPTTFRDDEAIAQVLLNMSQAKAVLREKEKGVELKDVENIERPMPTSTRSLLTLKPLPKIDLKDKGKKKIEKEDESNTESEGILEAEKKFKQLARDEEMARKVQEDWEAEEEVKKLAEEEATNAALIQDFDDIKARIEADRLLALRLQDEERAVYCGRKSKIPFMQNKELLQ